MADELESNVKKSIRVVDRAIDLCSIPTTKKDLLSIGEALVSAIKSEIQNEGGVQSGELLSSVGIFNETANSIDVGSSSPHSEYYEYGHGPIRPVNAKALHFVTKDGEEVFTKYVGPVEPTGVFERTILSQLPKEVERIAEEKKRELERSKA
jgi:hypothetical protein